VSVDRHCLKRVGPDAVAVRSVLIL
jgi:hypothetical protein